MPSRPATPIYLESDSTSITLGFTVTEDDGGLMITNYVLEMTTFDEDNWQEVTSYDGISLMHKVQVGTDAIAPNVKYRFQINARNAIWASPWSPTIDLVVAPLPSAPELPIKI